jgi:hypothetical protein
VREFLLAIGSIRLKRQVVEEPLWHKISILPDILDKLTKIL